VKRFAVATTMVLAALLAPGAAAQVPRQDSVIGSGVAQAGVPFDFTIDARSGPSDENPTGQASFRSSSDGSVFFEGPVICLSVQGNVATVNLATPQFSTVTMEITDSPSGDLIRAIPTPMGSPCALTGSAVDFAVTSGDVVVVDAPPLPTSKDQCKKGGWQTFGVFKNQGDCVSFVAKGGPE
jgi:hypothetical protein